jgi:rhamnulokinase
MGVELDAPVVSARAREMNFTNEAGCGGRIRFLKNLSGLWLVQECRRAWAAAGTELDYAALTDMAREAEPFRSIINPGARDFLAPKNMPEQIAEFCHRSGQPAPRNPGEFIRCALESLALLYRHTLGQLEALTGRAIDVLHIVGGGSNNDLLNEFSADALGVRVLAGPAEATAAGNVLLQALALGDLPSIEAAREVVRNSFALRLFEPRGSAAAAWEQASMKFGPLLESILPPPDACGTSAKRR